LRDGLCQPPVLVSVATRNIEGEHGATGTVDAGPDCANDGPACKQVGGFVTEWEGLTFATVHGAGHMVPATRPMFALEVLKNFLGGEW
jgi:hypothetical protein